MENKVAQRKKKVVKPTYATKRDYKVPMSTLGKARVNSDQNSLSKGRIDSNKSASRHRVFKHVPSAATIDKNNLKMTSNSTTRDKSVTRRVNLIKNNEPIIGWTSESSINKNYVSDRSKVPTKIPSISRHLVSNTAEATNKKSRFEGSLSPESKANFNFSRSNTQGKQKQHLFSPGDPIPQNLDSDRDFNENLNRANSEISILRQELVKKNNELLKLKKLGNKSKTPHGGFHSLSPNKSATSIQKKKIKSHLTIGNRRKVNERDKSNSQSDEYYETTKVSPTSSYSTSVYSKGISQIKSSQSCRQVDPENPVPVFHNKLQAVKESEEEQMTETFTKINKKFSQPQQKEISKKNTPRQNEKNLQRNDSRGTSRDRGSTNGSNSRRNKASANKTKGANKKSILSNNVNINFNISSKQKVAVNKEKVSENTILPKIDNKDINLPNINKNSDNVMKFDHSLVGFATKSLSKNGKLKIQKGKMNLNSTGNKNDLESNLNPKNSLINVPKKYQYRGKRLNIDNQSISSSAKSRITTESYKNQQMFHTKSGPIQTNEVLYMKSSDIQPLHKSRKIKLIDYRLKGVSSPSENTVMVGRDSEYNTHQDFTSANKTSMSRKVVNSRQTSSRSSVKPEKAEIKKKITSNKENIETQELIKKRLELLQLGEDDEAEFVNNRHKKQKEAKKSIPVSESVAQSRYAESQKCESEANIKNHVISIDSKMYGSLLQGNFSYRNLFR